MRFENGGRLCEDLDDLPILDNAKYLYLDFETTSGGNPDIDALNVWRNCYIAGICVTADDHEEAWYIPIGHNTGGNLPWKEVYEWLVRMVNSCEVWVNQNVKYDMHVFTNNTGALVECKVYCTLTQAKILNSDRMQYSLDILARDWLGKDITHHADTMKPYLYKNKDYGWIPVDIMAHYGTDDVLVTRELHKYILANMPEESQGVCETENEMTMLLYHAEREGMNIDVNQVRIAQLQTLTRMTEIDAELETLVGYAINASSNEDCFDVICIRFGLPVIEWTDAGSPSFDKKALKSYLAFPNAPKEILKLILEYRKLSTFNSVFLTTYLDLQIDGVLHPTYNQTVRTGRMSCSKPNMQQLMPEAKALVVPEEGYVLITADYAQIEYRLIVHYIKDPDAIAAYQQNPDTDYHVWVAALCNIKRKPAKTVNFLMGYGGGKAKLLGALSVDADLIADIDASDEKEFARLARMKAEEVYNTYHAALPGLRITTRQAENLCRSRGYVRNLYGRRRHLPREHARKAFNTINQSSAADLMKERCVALWKAGFIVIGSIHDEIVIKMRIEDWCEDKRREIAAIMEKPSVPLRVPIRVSIGSSTKSWLDASENSKPVS